MIPKPADFETLWEAIRTADFLYDGSQPLQTVVRNNVLLDDRGVYVVRSSNLDVLYIGMTGTITQAGTFKGQGLLGRLTNTRGKKRNSEAMV